MKPTHIAAVIICSLYAAPLIAFTIEQIRAKERTAALGAALLAAGFIATATLIIL
jgi:hypothetical protein